MRFLGLADVLRQEAARVEPHFNVIEVDGWQARGTEAAFDGGCFTDHHTAGGTNTIAGSLGLVINGGANTAPGPLANLFQDHQPGDNAVDQIYVVAAGKANHAGVGGWVGISGNSRTVGIEVEHDGRSPFPHRRRAITLRVGAAVLTAIGSPAGHRCHHWEWSYPPGSKIDVCCDPEIGGKCSGHEWRVLTDVLMQGGPIVPPPDLAPVAATILNQRGDAVFIWTPEGPHPDVPLFKSGMLYEVSDYAVNELPGTAAEDVLGAVQLTAAGMYNVIAARVRAAQAAGVPLS